MAKAVTLLGYLLNKISDIRPREIAWERTLKRSQTARVQRNVRIQHRSHAVDYSRMDH